MVRQVGEGKAELCKQAPLHTKASWHHQEWRTTSPKRTQPCARRGKTCELESPSYLSRASLVSSARVM